MKLIDTHCHVHEKEFVNKDKDLDQLLGEAKEDGVMAYICVGTSAEDSNESIQVSIERPDCYGSIAMHPHSAGDKSLDQLHAEFKQMSTDVKRAIAKGDAKIVAVGECGLDYFYHESKEVRDRQKELFRWHIELALDLNLPMIFHIRSAFDDFFSIIDQYEGIRGVVHSFSAHITELQGSIDRGLYVGLNGIMTFTKDEKQLESAKAVPIDRMVLETDAPFLTPKPFRGMMCEPKHIVVTAEFLSELRGESLDFIARETTNNAQKLFGITI